jgi:hypothetical protein
MGLRELLEWYVFGSESVDVEVEISYKSDWTPRQRQEADNMVKTLNELAVQGLLVGRTDVAGRLIVVPRKGNNKKRYEQVHGPGSVPDGYDVDHIQPLSFGGLDEVSNMAPGTDLSINRSIGNQLASNAKKEAKEALGKKMKNGKINVTKVTIK